MATIHPRDIPLSNNEIDKAKLELFNLLCSFMLANPRVAKTSLAQTFHAALDLMGKPS